MLLESTVFDLGEQRVIVLGKEHYGGSGVSANVSFFLSECRLHMCPL